MSDAKQNLSSDLLRVSLTDEHRDLVSKKMRALLAYQEAQASLTRANLALLDAGIRPELGVMCW